ncbi:hypothetical protein FALBO_15119 [Fusarium albosuccineum]|uniref:Uncharacterized protein n=1 Tax=Fusarium albosuccineum TaxID=1237068 RepID=A0A8H4P6G1_9HYPO|nr:hypothetical protein FALBO_15119 [Fusarium albosuccineum]
MTHQQGPAHQSPGNELYPEIPPMRAPSLEFVYRLVAKMHPTDDYEIENIQGTGIYYKLDARYTIRTLDGHHVFVQARGLFRPGPGVNFDFEDSMEVNYSQDQVEYFTHITFEAAGGGPYNWMNGIVAIGALQSFQGAAVIDCWRLTNFLGCAIEDVYVGR